MMSAANAPSVPDREPRTRSERAGAQDEEDRRRWTMQALVELESDDAALLTR